MGDIMDDIRKREYELGYEEGYKETLAKTLYDLVKDEIITKEKALEIFGGTYEELEEIATSIEDDCISVSTLNNMDKAVTNFKKGNVSEAIDLSNI